MISTTRLLFKTAGTNYYYLQKGRLVLIHISLLNNFKSIYALQDDCSFMRYRVYALNDYLSYEVMQINKLEIYGEIIQSSTTSKMLEKYNFLTFPL